MGTRQKLKTRLHGLEKRLNDLEIVFGGLVEKSQNLDAVVELLANRGLIPRQEVSERLHRTLGPYRERIGQYAEEELQKLVDSLLDDLMESLEEGEMPHA